MKLKHRTTTMQLYEDDKSDKNNRRNNNKSNANQQNDDKDIFVDAIDDDHFAYNPKEDESSSSNAKSMQCSPIFTNHRQDQEDDLNINDSNDWNTSTKNDAIDEMTIRCVLEAMQITTREMKRVSCNSTWQSSRAPLKETECIPNMMNNDLSRLEQIQKALLMSSHNNHYSNTNNTNNDSNESNDLSQEMAIAIASLTQAYQMLQHNHYLTSIDHNISCEHIQTSLTRIQNYESLVQDLHHELSYKQDKIVTLQRELELRKDEKYILAKEVKRLNYCIMEHQKRDRRQHDEVIFLRLCLHECHLQMSKTKQTSSSSSSSSNTASDCFANEATNMNGKGEDVQVEDCKEEPDDVESNHGIIISPSHTHHKHTLQQRRHTKSTTNHSRTKRRAMTKEDESKMIEKAICESLLEANTSATTISTNNINNESSASHSESRDGNISIKPTNSVESRSNSNHNAPPSNDGQSHDGNISIKHTNSDSILVSSALRNSNHNAPPSNDDVTSAATTIDPKQNNTNNDNDETIINDKITDHHINASPNAVYEFINHPPPVKQVSPTTTPSLPPSPSSMQDYYEYLSLPNNKNHYPHKSCYKLNLKRCIKTLHKAASTHVSVTSPSSPVVQKRHNHKHSCLAVPANFSTGIYSQSLLGSPNTITTEHF